MKAVETEDLDLRDIDLLLESLGYTKDAFSRYQYPSDHLRREQLGRVEKAQEKLRRLRDRLKGNL